MNTQDESILNGEDREYEEKVIEKVQKEGTSWSIKFEDSWSFSFDDSLLEPVPGMIARFYGKGVGYPARGLFIDNKKIFYRTKEEQERLEEAQRKEYEEELERRKLEPKIPDTQIPGFEWTEDMGEISGFGSGYEKTCRIMVSQGCKWWDEHPKANPIIATYEQVFGITEAQNQDAKDLEIALLKNIEDSTGAMLQASLQHIYAWKALGSWGKYQEAMRRI